MTLPEGEYEFLGVRRAAGAEDLAAARSGAQALSERRRQTGGGAPSIGSGGGMTAVGQAAQALEERGEKLRTLGTATEALSHEAETFADLATQLRKANTGGSHVPID